MRRPMVAGNWKMHGSRSANGALLAELEQRLTPEWQVDVVVFPPFVYLADAVRMLEESDLAVGAQDVCAEPLGALTGQVAALMLKDVGCRYVIVGHSERRRLFHEDDVLVARKFGAALQAGLTPILCVGETLEEREANRTEAVVARQLEAVAAMNGASSFSQAILAYEPVWAIGTGRTASPDRRTHRDSGGYLRWKRADEPRSRPSTCGTDQARPSSTWREDPRSSSRSLGSTGALRPFWAP
jgi:triosephosphate isomerase